MMKIDASQLLVRTPCPKPDESFRGFILRLSEINGYEKPSAILSMAGISPQRLVTGSIDVNKLATLLGQDAEKLRQLSNRRTNGRFEPIHVMGNKIHFSSFRRKSIALCPECVETSGYIYAFMDMAAIDCCPFHRKWLISSCPTCKEPLSWLRPGLLKCNCGASLHGRDKQRPHPSDRVIQTALGSIRVVHGKKWAPSDKKVPVAKPVKRSPASFLWITSLISNSKQLENLAGHYGRRAASAQNGYRRPTAYSASVAQTT